MNQPSLPAAPPILRGAVPFWGMSSALARDPLAVFSRARALGDVVRLAVPGRHAVIVLAHPAHIRRVLQENYGNYRRTPFHDRLKIVLGDGLVTSEGERWHRQRQLLQPAFRAERIRRFIPIMSELSASCAVRWDQAAKTGQQLDISREMSELALGIVVRCMFGQETDADDVGIGSAVHVAQGWLASRFWSVAPNWTERLPTLANRRFRRALATLNGTVERIITRRLRAAEPGNDLLGMLLAAQGERAIAIDPRQVRDEVMTMLLAGHETSAAALTWVWHLLAENPCAAEETCDELDRVPGRGGNPQAEDLAKLSMARAVIQETMRLYPPVGWFGRLAARPDAAWHPASRSRLRVTALRLLGWFCEAHQFAADPRDTVANLKQFSKGQTLGGLKWKDLIEEGRR